MKRISRIEVVCSRAVAKEMCRYDQATIISEEVVDTRFDSLCDTDEEKDQFRTYRFVIESNRHTIGRWASFGVHVKIL